MILQKLILENFKSFRQETIIDLSIKNKEKNIILIWGKNWSGKTSILEAINILFYWIENKNIISYINDIAITKGFAECKIWLEYEDDDKSNIKIVRERYVKWDYNNDETNIKPTMIQSDFKARKNNQERNIDENLWREEIEVKIPKWVSQFFFFDWEKIKEMASDETPNLLKDSIEKIIWLEKVNTLISDLENTKKSIINSTPNNIKDEQIENKKLQIQMTENKLKIIQEDLDDINNEISITENEIKQKEDRYTLLFWHWSYESEKIQEFDDKLIWLKTELAWIEVKIKDFLSEQLPFSLMGPFFEKVDRNLKKAKNYREYKARKESNYWLKEKIIEWLFKPHDIIRGNKREEKNLTILEEKISEILNEQEQEKPIIDITDNETQNLYTFWNKIDFSWNTIIDLIENRERIIREIKHIEKQKEILSVQPDKEKEQQILISEISTQKESLWKAIWKRESFVENFNRIEDEKNEYYLELKKMKEWYERFNKQKVIINKIDDYVKTLKIFKNKLRIAKIDSLTENISYMFKKIYNKSENISEIKIDPENFDIQIFDKSWNRKPKKDISTWEKSIFSISLIRWLSKTSNLELPIVIDAPLSVLDKDHTENILKDYFPSASHQVIILTKDKDMLPNSKEYNMIKDIIEKEYVLDFNNKEDITTIKKWYFYN